MVFVDAFRKEEHRVSDSFRIYMPEGPEVFVKDRIFEICPHAEQVH